MIRFIAIACIRFYRLTISPMLPHSCRFSPTCSLYAIDAISRYGTCKGIVLSIARILRCNPWTAGGIDPVPLPRKGSWLCR
jgi:putative membrane protein insertion efficiency factor